MSNRRLKALGIVASCIGLLASGGPASAASFTGEIGWFQTGPGFVYVRLLGDPVLCANGGSVLLNKTASMWRGTSIGSQPVTDDDINRTVAIAELAFTTH